MGHRAKRITQPQAATLTRATRSLPRLSLTQAGSSASTRVEVLDMRQPPGWTWKSAAGPGQQFCEALQRIYATLASFAAGDGMNLTQTFEVLCKEVSATFQVDDAQLWLIEEYHEGRKTPGWLALCASARSAGASLFPKRIELEHESIAVRLLREGRGHALHHLKREIADPATIMLSDGAEAALVIPLAVEKTAALGLLVLLDCKAPDRFTADDLRLAEMIAGHVALAVQSARQLQVAQERAVAYERGLRALAQTSAAITSTLQLEAVAQQIISVVCSLLQTRAAWLMVYDEEADALRLAAICGWDRPLGMELSLEHSVAGKVFLTEQPMFVPDVQAEPLFASKEEAMRDGIVAMLGLPLVAQGRAVGVLGLNLDPGADGVVRNPLEGPDGEWLRVFAGQAGVAVQNARLHDRLQTEHAFAEQLAQAAQRHAREMETIFESMAEGVAVFDAAGQIVRINPAGAALAGLSSASLVNMPSTALGMGIAENLVKREFNLTRHPLVLRALAGEVVRGEELMLSRADGTQLYLQVSVAPLHSEQGEVTGAVAILEDVTEQRLRQREQLAVGWVAAALNHPLDLKETLDTAVEALTAAMGADQSAILLADEKQQVLRVAAARGYGEEFVNAFTQLSVDAPLDLCLAFRQRKVQVSYLSTGSDGSRHPLLELLIQQGVQASLVVPLLVQDQALGVLIYSYLHPHQFLPAEQQIARAIADQIALAVVNARLYEEVADYVAWQENERHMLQEIINALPAGVILRDKDGRLFMYNEAALKLATNYDQVQAARLAGDASVVPVWELVEPDGSPAHLEILPSQEVILTGQSIKELQCCLRQSDGRIVPVLVNAAPVQDADGNLTRGVAVFQDITALKELERHKDEFISVASHELRGPLTVIRGQAQLLQRQLRRQAKLGQLPPVLSHIMESMESIESQTARLNDLVNDLLDVSRIQAGKLVLTRGHVEVMALLAKVIQHWQPASASHQLVLDADPLVEGVAGYWDAKRIEQILNNLIGNAIKYSPDGGSVAIRVRLDPEARWVTIGVQDEGLGIPPEALAHLFERFYRAGNVQSISGTGLGLYISKQLAVAHGGDLWAESPGPTMGSTFYLRLPLE